MSTETRQKLVDHPRLVLTHHSQKTDLLDVNKTNTWLVQFLLSLVQSCATPVMITALNSDHAPGTHHGGGRAVDLWNADWASKGDDDIRFILESASNISCTNKPRLIEIGFSGPSAKYKDSFKYCCDNRFIENTPDHVHFAVGTPT